MDIYSVVQVYVEYIDDMARQVREGERQRNRQETDRQTETTAKIDR